MLMAQPVGAKAVSRSDFAFPAEGKLDVVVFRPDVHVGSLSVGGIDEPNVEWTESARTNIQSALEASPDFADANIVFLDELENEQAEVLNQYRGLFEVVAGAMFTHVTAGDRLPTKTREVRDYERRRVVKETVVDWSVGEGAAQLKDITGSDYAMFVYTYDSYGDSGRKAAQVVGMLGCLIGACVIVNAGVHVGYAGIVDLNTGDIVWFNSDLAMGGDVRDEEGAEKRVSQLMREFPNREGIFADDD
jgi:hypothetical protein